MGGQLARCFKEMYTALAETIFLQISKYLLLANISHQSLIFVMCGTAAPQMNLTDLVEPTSALSSDQLCTQFFCQLPPKAAAHHQLILSPFPLSPEISRPIVSCFPS